MAEHLRIYVEEKQGKSLIEILQFWKKFPEKWHCLVNCKASEIAAPLQAELYKNDDIGYLTYVLSGSGGKWITKFNQQFPCITKKPRGLPSNLSKAIYVDLFHYKDDMYGESYATLEEIISIDWSMYNRVCWGFSNRVIPELKRFTTNPKNIRIVFFVY